MFNRRLTFAQQQQVDKIKSDKNFRQIESNDLFKEGRDATAISPSIYRLNKESVFFDMRYVSKTHHGDEIPFFSIINFLIEVTPQGSLHLYEKQFNGTFTSCDKLHVEEFLSPQTVCQRPTSRL